MLVASPSRERVEQYRLLREEIEGAVSRINDEHAELGSPAIHYLHQTYLAEEMAALYLAAERPNPARVPAHCSALAGSARWPTTIWLQRGNGKPAGCWVVRSR